MGGQGSSFIPKSSARVATTRTRSTHRIYILSYISYIVFFGTLFAVAGVYLYSSSITRNLESLKAQLATERNRFSTADIETIKLLDKRLNTAAQLVNESAAPSAIFADIEKIVASNIQFSGIKYKYLPNRQYELALTGRAEEFNEVIWQRELLSGASILKDAKVTKYDYSVAGEDATTDATLTFILTDTQPISLIPYVPEGSEETMATSTTTSTTEGGTMIEAKEVEI